MQDSRRPSWNSIPLTADTVTLLLQKRFCEESDGNKLKGTKYLISVRMTDLLRYDGDCDQLQGGQ
jgi:hypothetical protein